jgi:MFS family permease
MAQAAALDRVYRKILWRIMPMVMVLWVVAWMDRTSIGFAKLGMNSTFRLTDAEFGLAAGIFSLGYLLFEVPSNLVLLRIGARKTLTRIALLWGITCALTMFAGSATMLTVLRFLLGAFEAGLFPGVILYLTLWLPTERRATAVGMFASAAAMAGIISGPLGGLLLTTFNGAAGIAGWQWVFLIEGVLSILFGIVAWFVLTDKVDDAAWLSATERADVTADLARDASALGAREQGVWQAAGNPTAWLFCVIFTCTTMGNVVIAFFGPTILREAGVASAGTIGWIISGISVATVIAMIATGVTSGRSNDSRNHFLAATIGCIVGMVLLGFAVPHHTGLVIAALFIITVSAGPAIAVFWGMPPRVFSGTAVAVAIAFISSVSNIGNFFAPAIMGSLKQSTGTVAVGAWILAGTYLLSLLLTLLFVRQRAPA